MDTLHVKSRLKNAAANFSLVCFGCAVAVLITELSLSLFMPQQVRMATAPTGFFLRYDPDIGWVNREGATGVDTLPKEGGRYDVRINTLGYRGREVAIPKPLGTRRIVFIGDSNTFGYGVQERERFTDLLAAKAPSGTEIVNLGVFGYGSDQEAIYLERNALRFEPDMVVLAVSAGDLSDLMSSVNAGAAKPFCRMINGKLTLNNVPVPQSTPLLSNRSLESRTKVFLYRHSHLYRLLLSRVLALNRYMTDTVKEMEENEGFEVMLEIIRGMKQVCSEGGIGFKVLLISHGEWIEGYRRNSSARIGYYQQLKQMLKTSGIEVIDPTDVFVSWQKEPLFFTNDAVHLTAAGNRLVAGELHGILKR